MRATGLRCRTLLVLACLTVVLGILGMHALNHQATMGDHHGTAMVGASQDAHAPASAFDTGTDTDTDESATGSGHGTGDMVMLCVAMLVGVAAGLLLARGLRRASSTRSVVARPGPLVAGARPQRLATGPPYVWEHSVVRC